MYCYRLFYKCCYLKRDCNILQNRVTAEFFTRLNFRLPNSLKRYSYEYQGILKIGLPSRITFSNVLLIKLSWKRTSYKDALKVEYLYCMKIFISWWTFYEDLRKTNISYCSKIPFCMNVPLKVLWRWTWPVDQCQVMTKA